MPTPRCPLSGSATRLDGPTFEEWSDAVAIGYVGTTRRDGA
jgi:hypothetical protein